MDLAYVHSKFSLNLELSHLSQFKYKPKTTSSKLIRYFYTNKTAALVLVIYLVCTSAQK